MHNSILDALMPTTRQGILAATFSRPEHWWYMSELAGHLSLSPSSLQRELASLASAGILEHKQDGNRSYYRANSSCPVYQDLKSIVMKTVGLVDVLRENLSTLEERITLALVFGSVAEGTETAESDIDLFIVGKAGLSDIAPALKKAEKDLARPVNPVKMTTQELKRKVRANQNFIQRVLAGPKLFVLGGEDDLAKITG